MILSGEKIREQMMDSQKAPSEKIIVTPVLDWDEQTRSTDASIDIRLGQRFRVPRRTKIVKLDHLALDHDYQVRQYFDEYTILIGDYFVLHPQQFVLGESLEWIHLPSKYAAYVIGRSSWGRDGLVIATATGVHPFFSGVLTLEITNLGEIPVYLYPGLRIAQLFMHEVEHTVVKPLMQDAGRRGQTRAKGANAAGREREVIDSIKKMRESKTKTS